MTRIAWWCVLGLLGVAITGIDILTSPYLQFPFLFVIPVGLAAWYLSRGAAVGFAVGLVACRYGYVVALEQQTIPVWAAGMNAVLRMLVLVGLAVLIALARHRQQLTRRVEILEGMLPICAFCKKIRRSDGVWEEIETYVSQHSAARFSHGYCEACAREHYGEYLSAPDGNDG